MVRSATIIVLGLVATVACSIISAKTSLAQSAKSCWMTFGEPEPTTADYGDEVLCIMSDTSGFVRESALYGTGVEGCNSIKITKQGGAISLFIDYSNCTNGSPNHTITCPTLSGDLVKCAETHESEAAFDTYLKSCPAQRCDTPVRR